MLADFNEVQGLKVAKEKDNMIKVEMAIKGDEPGVSIHLTIICTVCA